MALQDSRDAAFIKQSGRCFYCHSPMWQTDCEGFASTYELSRKQALCLQSTAEHLKPRAEGGSHRRDNIAAACWYCNHKRHARKWPLSSEAFGLHVQRRQAAGGWHGLRPQPR